MTSCLHCGHEDEAEFLYCPRCGTKVTDGAAPADSLIGRTLNDKYRVVAEIGAGAMGTVYLAEHIGLKKKVALKVLHPDLQVSDESLRRFQREGIAAGKFNHPNLIQIFDFDKSEGRLFYLAMEFVEGSNLKVYLRRKGRLDIPEASRIARQILSCLAEAHRHGIVHRDLKPDNIMITPGPGGTIAVKVLDFGLSKLVDRRADVSLVTQQGRILGTPLYMAPEQCAGDEADSRSDLYAMGLILYEMVTGLRPFPEESTTELLFTRATKEAPSILAEFPDLEVPAELDQLIVRALQRRREDRFESADEMLAALNAIRAARPSGAPSSWGAGTTLVTSVEELQKKRAERQAPSDTGAAEPTGPKRSRLPVALAFGGVVVVGTLAAFFLLPSLPDAIDAVSRPPRVSMIPMAERSPEELQYVSALDSARANLLARSPDPALMFVNQALAYECADEEAYFLRAEAWRAKGDPVAALASYDDALERDPDYVDALLGAGWTLFEQGRLTEAQERFVRAGEVEPEAAGVLVALGATASRLKQHDAAQDFLEEALAAEPSSHLGQLYLGRVLLDQADRGLVDDEGVPELRERAVQALTRAKLADKDSERARLWLAEAYLAAGDLASAERELADASQTIDVPVIQRDLASLYLLGDRFEEARALLVGAVRRHPSEAALHNLLGVAFEGLGDVSGALDALRTGVQLGSDDPRAWQLYATLLHRQGLLDQAIDAYERVRELWGEPPQTNLGLGLAYFENGQYRDAGEALERVLEDDWENAVAHFYLGHLYADYLGKPEEARDLLGRYFELGGNDARARNWLDRLGR